MKKVIVRFRENFFFQDRLYDKGFSADALRVPKRTKDDPSFYLILSLAGVFLVPADIVEEIVEPEIEL